MGQPRPGVSSLASLRMRNEDDGDGNDRCGLGKAFHFLKVQPKTASLCFLSHVSACLFRAATGTLEQPFLSSLFAPFQSRALLFPRLSFGDAP